MIWLVNASKSFGLTYLYIEICGEIDPWVIQNAVWSSQYGIFTRKLLVNTCTTHSCSIMGHWFHFIVPKFIRSKTRNCFEDLDYCLQRSATSKQGRTSNLKYQGSVTISIQIMRFYCGFDWIKILLQIFCSSASDSLGMVGFQSCLCWSVPGKAQHPYHFISSEAGRKASWRHQTWPKLLCEKGLFKCARVLRVQHLQAEFA